jgi:8-oxo-dGTP diphosphatase
MEDYMADEIIKYTADFVLLSQGKVLLVQRGWDPFADHWALPGGHVDKKERALHAAVRELGEEAGIHVDPASLRLVDVYDDPDRDPRGRYVSVAYTATLPQLIPPKAGDDASAARWWPLAALPELAFDHADIVSAATAL